MHIPRRFVSLAAAAAGSGAGSDAGAVSGGQPAAPDDRATGLAALALLHLSASCADPLGFAALLGSSPFDGRFPASGRTAELWQTLATVAAHDLGVARTLEPHLDALGILHQAGLDDLATDRSALASSPSRALSPSSSPAHPSAPTSAAGSSAAGSSAAGSSATGSAAAKSSAGPSAPPTWGVFAAEGGPNPLTATLTDGAWALTGTKPWCSLADRLDAALVSATVAPAAATGAPTPAATVAPAASATGAPVTVSPGAPTPAAPVRQLFAVDLRHEGVSVEAGAWHARGLAEIPSGPVHFDHVAATPVGAPGWYLTRPGFSWGGIAVAACWFGGAVGLARTLYIAATTPRQSSPPPADAAAAAATGTATTAAATAGTATTATATAGTADAATAATATAPVATATPLDPLLAMHLGAVDALLEDARRALAEAAAAVDSGEATGDAGRLLAKRTRATVARTCELVLERVGHALGPAPLALNDAHAKRVADLTLYIRQHHSEKDEVSLGRQLAASGAVPW